MASLYDTLTLLPTHQLRVPHWCLKHGTLHPLQVAQDLSLGLSNSQKLSFLVSLDRYSNVLSSFGPLKLNSYIICYAHILFIQSVVGNYPPPYNLHSIWVVPCPKAVLLFWLLSIPHCLTLVTISVQTRSASLPVYFIVESMNPCFPILFYQLHLIF